MKELKPHELKLVDKFLQRIAKNPIQEGPTDEATALAVWGAFYEIGREWREDFTLHASPSFFATVLQVLFDPWDVDRFKRVWKEIFDNGRVEEDFEKGKDGNLYSVYRLLAEPWTYDWIDDLEEEGTRKNSATGPSDPLCPCGCLQTVTPGGRGKPRKWAGPGCKERFRRQTLQATNV